MQKISKKSSDKELQNENWSKMNNKRATYKKIKQYIERINYKPIKIDMIKNAIWPISSNERSPWNSTISKALKNIL